MVRNWARHQGFLWYPWAKVFRAVLELWKSRKAVLGCRAAPAQLSAGLAQKSVGEKHQAKHFPSRGILNTWKIERLNTGKVDLGEELIRGFFLLLCFHVLVLGWVKQTESKQPVYQIGKKSNVLFLQ